MTMKQGLRMVVATIMVMGAQVASADVTAVYKMTSPDGSGTQTIHYADKQHVRVDMANDNVNRSMSLLKLDDKVYSITGKVVQDMSQLAGMMASMGKARTDKHREQAPIKYEDTGKTETIAGIKGKVYRFVEHGIQHEVVLGRHNDLQAAVLGVVEISKSSLGMMPEDSTNRIQQDVSVKNMVLLRLDDRIRLESIDTSDIPSSTFELPSKPQQMGNLGRLMKKGFGE